MNRLSFASLSLLLSALGGLAANLPAQAQKLHISVNNGDIRQISPQDGTNLGTFVPRDPNGHLLSPTFINFDSGGNLLVVDQVTIGLSKFSPTGAFLESFGAHNQYVGVAADAAGNIFAANSTTNTIDKFSSSGVALGTFADSSKGITKPRGLAFDKDGNLYVSNSQHDGNTFNYLNTITKYASDGTSLGVFATPTTDYQAQSIAFNSAGYLFVGGFNEYGRSGTILEFSPTGTSMGRFLQNYGIYDPLEFGFDAANNLFVDDNGSIFQYDSGGLFKGRLNKIDASVNGLAFSPSAAPNAAPEPSALVPLGLGALGLAGLRLRARRRC